MNDRSKTLCACLAFLVSSAALADTGESTQRAVDESGWLTVHAPRVLRHQADSRTSDANKLELVSIENRVNYAGLDLAMHADVLELRKRIVESAETGCAQLKALSPLADLDTAACEREAIDDAMERARTLVAAAMTPHAAE